MAEILGRASRGRAINQADLEADLLGIIHATGIGREDSEGAAWWHEGGNDSHLEIARQYMMLADAANPLDPSVCTTALRPELNGMIHNRWTASWREEACGDHASIRSISWESLTAREQMEIREMARSLSAFHRSMAPARRPRKDDIDSLLLFLAEVYTNHTGYAGDHRELPHSVGSLFVLFVREALGPFFDPSESSAVALARRWKRLKGEVLAARPGPERA